MEKIYMEENQQKKRQNHQFGFSVGLSFFVAIFAMFSLLSFGLAVYGNNGGVSYAAPITTDTFNIKVAATVLVDDRDHPGVTVEVLADAATNNPVFCVEHTSQVNDGDGYVKDSSAAEVDYGLLYLLNHSYANGVSVTGETGSDAYIVESWVTQVAIYMYLNEKYPDNHKHDIDEVDMAVLKSAVKLVTRDGWVYSYTPTTTAPTIYDAYVKPLVTAAKTASSVRQLSITTESDMVTISSDKSYYESPLYTVSGDQLINYDITVSGLEGAYVVAEDGSELSPTGISSEKKFRVRIPANKVGTETIDVAVNAKGHFNTLKGEYFVSSTDSSRQKVITVTGDTTDVSAGTSFQIIPTPPTGMNAAQTIYFIGLIVLLCGVGIVYANAKPVESKQ